MSGSVLIIDGDQAFAETAQNALEAAGLVVWVRQDGTFDTVRELRPNVLMLNVELPRGSGFAICSRIRRDKELKTTPILLTSAQTTAEAFKRHAQSADSANDYAQKPLPVDDVVDRVGKLIALAPAMEGAPANGGPPGPPPMPPPLRKTGEETPVPAPPPLTPMPSGADMTPIPTRGLGSDDLWPSQQYDEQMRKVMADAGDVLPKGRVSPEERLQAMRALVKQHESQKRAFAETWLVANQRGQELARRIVGLTSELENRETRIRELETVATEFRAFQEEITRIFQEKDTEEARRAAYLTELEATRDELTGQLQESFERNTDDERRLRLIQEDLELLQNEKDAATTNLSETEAALEVAREQSAELEKRLDMTKSVATERAEEVGALRDQLDQVAFDQDQQRKKTDAAHEDKIEALLSEHVSALEEARETQEHALSAAAAVAAKELDDAESRHADLVEALTTTNESELSEALERVQQLDHQSQTLLSRAETLATDLEESKRGHAYEADRAQELEAELERTTASEANLRQARDTLEAKLGEATTALETARDHIQRQEADLEGARMTTAAQRERLDGLEQDVDTAQAELFERIAQVDHLEKQLSAIESRAKELETSHKTSEKTLRTTDNELRAMKTRAAEAEAERNALEQQVELLEEQHTRLEGKVRNTESMLEGERERFTKAEDMVRRARERIQRLEADDTADRVTAELGQERADRTAVEQALATAQEELSEREKSVSRLEGQRVDLNNALDEAEGKLETTEQELSQERTAREHLKNTLESERKARAEIEDALEDERHGAADRDVRLAELAKRHEVELEEMTTSLAAERNEHNEKLVDLSATLQAERDDRNLQLAELAAERDARTSAGADRDAQLAELVQQLEQERKLRTQSETELDELEGKIAQLEHHVAAERQEAEAATNNLQEQLATASGAQRSGDSRIKELEVQLATAHKRVAEIETSATSSGVERDAALEEKTREVHNLESVLANLNEELEIHRAQQQGLTQSADRAERNSMTMEGDLAAARRSVTTLERSEKSLMERVAEQEDTLNEWRFATESMKGTLSALQNDLESASDLTDDTAVGKSFEQLLGRIYRAVSMCMDTLEESEESMDLPILETTALPDDLTDDDVDIPIYTGEVEALDPLSDLESQGLRIMSRTPVTPVGAGQEPPKPPRGSPPPKTLDAAEPFAALMAELSATVDPTGSDLEKTDSGFGDTFDGEATTSDTRAITGKSSLAPVPEDEDEDEERNVTEIINISDLE